MDELEMSENAPESVVCVESLDSGVSVDDMSDSVPPANESPMGPDLATASSGSAHALTASRLSRMNSPVYNRTESDSSTASTSMAAGAFGAVNQTTQFLRLETIDDKDARRVIAGIKVAGVLAVATIIVMGVLKESDSGYDYFMLNRSYHAGVLAVVLGFTAALSGFYCRWLYRLRIALRSGKVFSARRQYALRSVSLRVAILYVVLITCIVGNVAILIDPGQICGSSWLGLMGGIRWTCYNLLLMLLTIDAHGIVLKEQDGRDDGMVRDEPLLFHWPKFVFWCFVEAFIIWMTVQALQDGHQIQISTDPGETCTWNARVQCELQAPTIVGSALVCGFFCVWGILYGGYLWKSHRQLKKRLYQDYKLTNTLLQIQLRFNMMILIIFLLGNIVLWFAGSEPCSSYVVTFFGIIPLILCWTALVVHITQPRIPADGPPKPYVLLQQFAWTEGSKRRKMEKRAELLAADCPCITEAPMFCFETAIKAFYWSAMIYDYTEAEGHQFQNLPEGIRELLGEIQTAMRLFNLVCRHLFYDRVLETKVLVGWNEKLIVVCARGSAETANFVADAKFLQIAHPPKRKYKGRTPRIHKGFMMSWEANGVRERVLDHVAALIDSASDRREVRVLCVGHSLGGAIASLAAMDIRNRCDLEPKQLSVYTFGCPRVGNHAFAEEYAELVPDTWHIINNQDIVAHGMKLFGWYKRAGQRVIVNTKGDLIVRPTLLELSLLQSPFIRSVSHHFNAEYQAALLTIIVNQLRASSRHADGLHGLLELLKAVPLVREALQSRATELGLNFMDAIRGLGHQATRTMTFSRQESNLFTASRHKSLLRAAGVADEDDPFHHAHEHAPVAVGFDDEGSLHDHGDPATMANVEAGVAIPRAAEKQGHSIDVGARLGAGWYKARRAVGAKARAARSGEQTESKRPTAEDSLHTSSQDVVVNFPQATPQHAHGCGRRAKCYVIPEDEDEDEDEGGEAADMNGTAAATAASGKRAKRCRWACPLTAKSCDLPDNASLQGTVVHIGAAPDMAHCRLACSKAKARAREAAQSKEAASLGSDHALPFAQPHEAHASATGRDPVGDDVDACAIDANGDPLPPGDGGPKRQTPFLTVPAEDSEAPFVTQNSDDSLPDINDA